MRADYGQVGTMIENQAMNEQIWRWGDRVGSSSTGELNRDVLIVARPGPLRDSLQSLLAAAPWLDKLSMTTDVLSALRAITVDRPALVIVLGDLPADGVEALLRWIRTEGSCSRSLVLVEDSQQRQEVRELGADMALIKGFPASKLFQAIEQLALQPKEARMLEPAGG